MSLTWTAILSIFCCSTSSSTSRGLFQGVWLAYPSVIISCSPSMSTVFSSGLIT